MKVKLFMPNYMEEFQCIGSDCIDTCCAGWDINIDEDTYKLYDNSTGKLKELVQGKFKENKDSDNYLNKGNMILRKGNICPFLNENLLCDIHGNIGEENLCITCKRYPRVYNIVDDIYELSGLPSCIEVCNLALRSKDKIEFIECEKDIDTDSIEIRRIVDSEAFEDSDSILQYFWDIRVVSINIIQNKYISLKERFALLSSFYAEIEKCLKEYDFEKIEDLLELVAEEDYSTLEKDKFNEVDDEFYHKLASEELLNNIKSVRLKEIVTKYKANIENRNNISKTIEENKNLQRNMVKLEYILENYIVNNMFKDLIPFNRGEELLLSLENLINKYKIIKSYALGVAIDNEDILNEEFLVNVIQSLSKDIEHNKVYANILK